MKFFYLSITRDPSEESEVHTQDCPSLPPMEGRSYLGPFNNASEALRNATEKKGYVTLCPRCCKNKKSAVVFFSKINA